MQTNTLLRILIYFARQDFCNLKKKKRILWKDTAKRRTTLSSNRTETWKICFLSGTHFLLSLIGCICLATAYVQCTSFRLQNPTPFSKILKWKHPRYNFYWPSLNNVPTFRAIGMTKDMSIVTDQTSATWPE